MDDPYRILGVPLDADEAAIRGAYLSLMRRFHPDQNPSPEAAQRTKDVTAAYRLLSDPDRRATLDRDRAMRERPRLPRAMPPPPLTRRRTTGRNSFFLIAAVAGGLLYVALTRPLPIVPRGATPVEEPAPTDVAIEAVALAPAEPALVPSAPDVPVAEPQLDPPHTLPAVPAPPPPIVAATTRRPAPSAPARPIAAPDPVEPIALAPLERHADLLYTQSYLHADDRRRGLLRTSRTLFLDRLGRCGTDRCRRDAYLARNQEIAAIMRG